MDLLTYLRHALPYMALGSLASPHTIGVFVAILWLWKSGRKALSTVAVVIALGSAGISVQLYGMAGDGSAGAGFRMLGSMWFAGSALAYLAIAVVGYVLVARGKRQVTESTEEATEGVVDK